MNQKRLQREREKERQKSAEWINKTVIESLLPVPCSEFFAAEDFFKVKKFLQLLLELSSGWRLCPQERNISNTSSHASCDDSGLSHTSDRKIDERDSPYAALVQKFFWTWSSSSGGYSGVSNPWESRWPFKSRSLTAAGYSGIERRAFGATMI